MDSFFDKRKCIVKITPIHETVEATDNGYEIITDFDVYEKFEKPLVEAGWDVIVFVPSKKRRMLTEQFAHGFRNAMNRDKLDFVLLGVDAL